jgi:hypothetical protein
MTAFFFDGSFPHRWTAEVLEARPLILPSRHYVYPRDAEEVERGALEVLIRPGQTDGHDASGIRGLPPFRQEKGERMGHGRAVAGEPEIAQPFLATCALGFRDPAVPTGLWSTPEPDKICAVSGGYAYVIDTTAPERFTMIPYRPVMAVRPVVEAGLLLFVGHHSILAWGRDGQAWDTEKLSDEGVTITSVEDGILRGAGWEMRTDKETPFALDLRRGARVPLSGS